MQSAKINQTSRILNRQAILSTYCLVISDSITGFSSGKDWVSLALGHLILYPDLVRLKVGAQEITCQREHTVFVERQDGFRRRLFLRLGNQDDAIEIIGRNRKIVEALKHAGYRVEVQPS